MDPLVEDSGEIQEKFVGGAKNTIESWCQATGNLTRESAIAITICQGPITPIASWITSNGTWSINEKDISIVSKWYYYKIRA